MQPADGETIALFSLWVDEDADVRRSWGDLMHSGHGDLITLDYKLADALMQIIKEENRSDSAQRLNAKANQANG